MKRVAELDALRGLAALAIMVYHLKFHPIFFGWTRVDMFFVLSGFLVTSATLKHGKSWWYATRFFLRRLLRIGPMYFTGLLAVLLVHRIMPGPVPTSGLGYYLTLTQHLPTYWGGDPPEFSTHFVHTWSLALEVRFALIWPGLVILAGRRRLMHLALLGIATGIMARSCGISQFVLLGRIDSFALGALLTALVSEPEALDRRRDLMVGLFAVCGAAALGVVLWNLTYHWGEPFPSPVWTVLAASTGAFSLIGLVVCHAGHPALAVLRRGPLPVLGRLSFGIYLFHPIVFWVIETALEHFALERTRGVELGMLAASVAAAALSWSLVEKPALCLKERVATEPPAGEATRRRAGWAHG